ncbi:hypothetical protein BJ322DRAFT_516490 [Thelephora terrestris]|uniref:BZIP domain-containing protein n=1 Tax=Thelephora terrestris TaxID=56493 RepID=A0A9P6L0F9_9AGAM|nr:hypothetical protein BJ322DRAFT_516490 [Thelephora terrestris]
MSHLSSFVSADVLSSPVSEAAPWSNSQDAPFSHYSQSDYSLPASPYSASVPHSPAMQLKSRLSPDSSSDGEQLCMPTYKLFDLPATPLTGRSPSPALVNEQQSFSGGVQRQGSFTTTGIRKPRERISTKDFIPPDVSGLSKREARLVKNRAAAFLSRQRKREEFECMEVRVAELEQENARLLALAKGEDSPALSEIEQLKARLAAAEQRTQQLNAQLKQAEAQPPAVKMETIEPEIPSPVLRSSPLHTNKSGAGLGLMVLLCALPSLLSVPTQPNVPSSFSLPLSDHSLSSLDTYSSFDFNSLISGDQHDWSITNPMDLDFDMTNELPVRSSQSLPISTAINGGKLELGDQSLDISFDAISSEDGKIRVRIHPPASASGSPRSLSPLPSTPGSSSPVPNCIKSEQEDPFLGVGGFDFGSELSLDQDISGARKRIRIALRNMPGEGSEGGEWEVEVC